MELSETRKRDRAIMAKKIVDLAGTLDITVLEVENEGENSICPRRVMIRLQDKNGLAINVDFDGESPQPNVFVLSWHMATDSPYTLCDTFAPGSVNQSHHRKATEVANGFLSLSYMLRRGFLKSKTGFAYREQAHLA